ncbi:uncharacterized protein LOC124138138 [Haliotis rufescens]|uniref:uncharacterized protein LOC124138138 n=1 Tax=Haliotis rufescens TaxID=6454 RepID=UPI00201E8B0F|nr:uncharacterized protein LOC124138138 [Haliotis rufescens]
MENSGKVSLRRQSSFSRQPVLAVPMVGFARCKKIVCIGVFFAAGVLCGHIFTLLANRSGMSSAHTEHEQPAAKRAALIAEAEKRGAEEALLSRKKDMSLQFRDYQPRHIFINCGGTFPKNVDLFIDTYPSSHKFVIFSFIPDATYAPLYSVYPSHTLVSPAACDSANGSTRMELKSVTGESRQRSVPTVDIGQWVKDNTHTDEHIVLKIDASVDVEKSIAKRLAETSAIEWVNKFYTATKDQGVVDFYHKEFQKRGEEVMTWDEVNGTYGDYKGINPTRNPPSGNSIVKECGNAKLKQFPLFLYAAETTPALNRTLTLLKTLSESRSRRLPVALFLPTSFIKTYRLLLESLFSNMDGGLYINQTVPLTGKEEEDDVIFSPIRNQVVAAENRFSSVGLILQNVLAGKAVQSPVVEKLVRERHYNIFVKVLEIQQNQNDGASPIKIPTITDYEAPVLDISRPGTEASVLFLLNRYSKDILPLTECLKYVHSAG